MVIINIVLIIFITLILLHVCKQLNTKIIEGNSNKTDSSKYQDTGLQDDPLYLATINASNIQYLKNNIDDISDLRQQIIDVSNQVQLNSDTILHSDTILQLNQQQATSNTEATGLQPGDEDQVAANMPTEVDS